MIIPDNLSPLPVAPPASGGDDRYSALDAEAFVQESTVRQLLVGPMKVSPMQATTLPHEEGFAGRDDLAVADQAFVTIPSPVCHADKPAKSFVPGEPHPALAEPRYAAPPRPRLRIERTARGNHRRSDRYWVLGMGVAMLATLLTGALVQFASSKTTHNQMEVIPTIEAPTGTQTGETEAEPSYASAGYE